MTTCIKCGAPVPDGELFCEQCAQNGGIAQPHPAPLPIGRMQTPPRPAPRPARRAPEPDAKHPSGHAARVFAVCCVLLLLAGAYFGLTGSAQLRRQQAELARLEEKNAFFDQYAVCVNVGAGLYHRYGCERFSLENFEILNEKLAVAEGYSPCPDCVGQ